MKCLWLFLNNVCLATTFLQIGNKNAEKEKWKINNKMCFVFTSPPPEVSVWRSDRSGPQIPGLPSHLPSITQYNTVQDNIATGGRGFDFPTGRFAGVETLVRAGDPGQSEVAGHRAAGVRDGGRHINQHLQRREHTLRSSASIRNLGKISRKQPEFKFLMDYFLWQATTFPLKVQSTKSGVEITFRVTHSIVTLPPADTIIEEI